MFSLDAAPMFVQILGPQPPVAVVGRIPAAQQAAFLKHLLRHRCLDAALAVIVKHFLGWRKGGQADVVHAASLKPALQRRFGTFLDESDTVCLKLNRLRYESQTRLQ